jgi:hypothetical protein
MGLVVGIDDLVSACFTGDKQWGHWEVGEDALAADESDASPQSLSRGEPGRPGRWLPQFQGTLQTVVSLGSVLFAVSYVVARMSLSYFYAPLGLTPEDVGFTQLTLVGAAVQVSVLVLIVPALAGLSGWAGWATQRAITQPAVPLQATGRTVWSTVAVTVGVPIVFLASGVALGSNVLRLALPSAIFVVVFMLIRGSIASAPGARPRGPWLRRGFAAASALVLTATIVVFCFYPQLVTHQRPPRDFGIWSCYAVLLGAWLLWFAEQSPDVRAYLGVPYMSGLVMAVVLGVGVVLSRGSYSWLRLLLEGFLTCYVLAYGLGVVPRQRRQAFRTAVAPNASRSTTAAFASLAIMVPVVLGLLSVLDWHSRLGSDLATRGQLPDSPISLVNDHVFPAQVIPVTHDPLGVCTGGTRAILLARLPASALVLLVTANPHPATAPPSRVVALPADQYLVATGFTNAQPCPHT